MTTETKPNKRRRGRPSIGPRTYVNLSDDLRQRIEVWGKRRAKSLPDAIRQLLELALSAEAEQKAETPRVRNHSEIAAALAVLEQRKDRVT